MWIEFPGLPLYDPEKRSQAGFRSETYKCNIFENGKRFYNSSALFWVRIWIGLPCSLYRILRNDLKPAFVPKQASVRVVIPRQSHTRLRRGLRAGLVGRPSASQESQDLQRCRAICTASVHVVPRQSHTRLRRGLRTGLMARLSACQESQDPQRCRTLCAASVHVQAPDYSESPTKT